MLIGISGKKQSGKGSVGKFLEKNAPTFWPQMAPRVEELNVGDAMKRFAMTFGVPAELLWGTNEQKESLTHLKWVDLPYYKSLYELACEKASEKATEKVGRDGAAFIYENEWWDCLSKYKEEFVPKGAMTVREFLQQIGEEFFLGLDPDYWVRQYEAAVAASKADVILTLDIRQPKQVRAAQRAGGIVLRLTRSPFPEDNHISETGLDQDKFDWSKFDGVINNENLSIKQTNEAVFDFLVNLGWISRKVDRSLIVWGE